MDFSLLMFGIKSYTVGFDTILNITNTFTPCIYSGISIQLNINYEKTRPFCVLQPNLVFQDDIPLWYWLNRLSANGWISII